MDPVRTVVFVAVLPAVVATAVFLILRRIRRGSPGAAAVGPALAAGFVAGFLGAAGLPRWPPTDTWQWLPIIAALAAVAGIGERGRPSSRWALRVVVALFAAWVTDLDRTAPRIAIVVAGMLVVDAGFDGAARRGPRTLLATIVVVAAATGVALLPFTARLGTACAALAAAAGACLALSWRFPVSVRAVATCAATTLAAFWMNGVLYVEDLPPACVALLAAAPFAAWTPAPAADEKPLRAALVRIGLVAVAAAAAVAVAVVKSPPLDY